MTAYSARSVYAALFFVFLAGLSLGLWGRLVWRQDQAIVRAAARPSPELRAFSDFMLRVPGDCTGKPCTMSWYTNGGRALSPEYRWSAPVVRVPSSALLEP